MATITTLLKTKNKTKPEQPLWVILRHLNPDGSRVEVTISTGHSIKPQAFKKGKVTGENSIAINELVSQIATELYTAFETVQKRAEGIKSADVRLEYDRIVQERNTKEKWDEFLWLGEEHGHKKDAYDARRRIRRVSRDLGVKTQEVEELKQILRTTQDTLDVREGTVTVRADEKADLFVTYVQQYLLEQKNDHNGSTKYGYNAIQKLVNEYNPRLRIQDVNRVTMYELQDLLIQQGKLNTSIENYTSKIKSVLNYFQVDLNLSLSYKQYKCKLLNHDNDVLYFSLEQLEDFWKHQKDLVSHDKQPNRIANRAYDRVKDLMMFMCGTGLRYVDIFNDFRDLIRTETDRKGNTEEYIVMMPQKTMRKKITVRIPVTPLVKSILIRNEYKFRKMEDTYFRTLLAEFCQDIPSFQDEITWYEYRGQSKVLKLDPVTGKKPRFWQELGAHTARRTWINMAIQSGWLQPEIMGVTGHTDMNTLAGYYSKAKIIRGVRPLDFFERTH